MTGSGGVLCRRLDMSSRTAATAVSLQVLVQLDPQRIGEDRGRHDHGREVGQRDNLIRLKERREPFVQLIGNPAGIRRHLPAVVDHGTFAVVQPERSGVSPDSIRRRRKNVALTGQSACTSIACAKTVVERAPGIDRTSCRR